MSDPTIIMPRAVFAARVTLIPLEVVRVTRGCDAEAVLKSVADGTHPKCLRFVFNLAVKPDGRIRELRVWKNELAGPVDKYRDPKAVIPQILGNRQNYRRGEIEIAWCINAMTISRLVSAGELAEVAGKLTRASLASFLERRLQ